MRGDLVIVRAFKGVPLVRRVWEEVEHGVYITDDAHLERLLAGEGAIQPIGFPREDVFRFDPEIASVMDDLIQGGNWDWTKLVPV
ncbi:MAG: hypothetical protein Q8M54_03275 [Desulfobaccales bacterium]|nr:hypothetical protein [Desulfobaccales bacterium]